MIFLRPVPMLAPLVEPAPTCLFVGSLTPLKHLLLPSLQDELVEEKLAGASNEPVEKVHSLDHHPFWSATRYGQTFLTPGADSSWFTCPAPRSPTCTWCDAGVPEDHHHLFLECEDFIDLRHEHPQQSKTFSGLSHRSVKESPQVQRALPGGCCSYRLAESASGREI